MLVYVMGIVCAMFIVEDEKDAFYCLLYLIVGLDTNVKDDGGEEDVDETECYAWNELRLHPLLMKAICKLGFKEPTPIQKACIPAAAHQGKVV